MVERVTGDGAWKIIKGERVFCMKDKLDERCSV